MHVLTTLPLYILSVNFSIVQQPIDWMKDIHQYFLYTIENKKIYTNTSVAISEFKLNIPNSKINSNVGKYCCCEVVNSKPQGFFGTYNRGMKVELIIYTPSELFRKVVILNR